MTIHKLDTGFKGQQKNTSFVGRLKSLIGKKKKKEEKWVYAKVVKVFNEGKGCFLRDEKGILSKWSHFDEDHSLNIGDSVSFLEIDLPEIPLLDELERRLMA